MADHFLLFLSLLFPKIKRIEIYNISGALVQVVENPFSKGNNIQLRNLNKGVYILKAENTTQKFILE